MKKILFLLTAVLLITGLGLGARVLAGDEQLFMQVSPRTWVLDGDESVGGEAVDIHLAIPLSEVDQESIRVTVYRGSTALEMIGDSEEDALSIGADMRGDVVIKFVPDYSLFNVDDTLMVKVEGVFSAENNANFSFEFGGIEVKDAGFLPKITVKKN